MYKQMVIDHFPQIDMRIKSWIQTGKIMAPNVSLRGAPLWPDDEAISSKIMRLPRLRAETFYLPEALMGHFGVQARPVPRFFGKGRACNDIFCRIEAATTSCFP
jgi:hypothetical protein